MDARHVQVVGALLVLVLFAAQQFGKLNADASANLWPMQSDRPRLPCSLPSTDSGAFCCLKPCGRLCRHGALCVRSARCLADASARFGGSSKPLGRRAPPVDSSEDSNVDARQREVEVRVSPADRGRSR